MPTGGEISVNPLMMAQFEGGGRQRMMEEMMNKDRGNVKIVERSPATLFGFTSEMDGKTFKVDSPPSPSLFLFVPFST